MKLTLKNALRPFDGNLIEICNLVAGRERFRIREVPLLGRVLWDDSNMLDVERPFGAEKLFDETGVAIALRWSNEESPPKSLAAILIGTKWTGPIAYIHPQQGKSYPAFSNGDYADNHACGGTWTCVASKESYSSEEPEGFPSLQEALDYRFDRRNLGLSGRDRLFTESEELHKHIREVLKDIGLL